MSTHEIGKNSDALAPQEVDKKAACIYKAGSCSTILISVMAIVLLMFCCIFFWYAFEKTRCKEDNRAVPTIVFKLATNTQSNDVKNVVYGEDFQRKLGTIMTSRESVVKAEHDNFRAELGTWLSIFGLLAILATVMSGVLSFVCQQANLKDEKEDLKVQLDKSKEDIKKQLEETKKQTNGLMTKLTDYESKFTRFQSLAEITNYINSANIHWAVVRGSDDLGGISREFRQAIQMTSYAIHDLIELQKSRSLEDEDIKQQCRAVIFTFQQIVCNLPTLADEKGKQAKSGLDNYVWRFSDDDIDVLCQIGGIDVPTTGNSIKRFIEDSINNNGARRDENGRT